ncbi:MAG: alpha-hydroxy-acid oxidizing protein [Rhodocyclaceae bacterium]|nr:alpha-hydroxy-acid oxidizing protein [Rhodocyclaceae bacterium]
MTADKLPVSLPEYASRAAALLDANARAYFEGGAADELTLAANPRAWQEIALLPRVLRPLAGGATTCHLLGRRLAHPILLAPVAHQCMAHPDGEIATACAASAQGAGLVLSTQSSLSLEQVASVVASDAERGPLWFQLYLQHDANFNRDLVRRAEAAGYEALVVTVDAPCSGARDRERRAGFELPPGISMPNLAGLPPRPRASGGSPLFDGLLPGAPGWAEIAALCERTRLPVLLKGILHPDDAREALRCGARGVIVSNHGGRTLDTSLATAQALPAVADAVGDAMAVLVDGGIRRGTDVLKALALGAHAVLIGRPQIHGLVVAGAMGVAHVIRLLHDELEIAMALCGCSRIEDIDRRLLVAAG